MSSININEEHEVAELRRQLAEATRGRDSAEYREACLMYAEAHDGDDKPSVTNLIAWLVSTGTLMAEKLATVIRERDEAKRDLSRIEKSMESAKAIVAEEHEKRVTAERERDELRKNIDDPELDCTDAAHPAWWRGHDHTAKVFCQLVNEILDGNDVSHGISGEPWQATKMRVADLRTKLATAEADEESAIAERDENEAAMQWLDTQTGGDGEFYFSTDGNDTSTVRNMAEKIAERFSKLESDSAAMLRTMTENESRLKDVIRRIGVSTTTGWITHELNHVLLDIPSGTAGRELLDEMRRKDAEIEKIHNARTRETRKARTAKLAYAETLRGKIDESWFGEQSPVWRYRGHVNGALWRTCDGRMIEYGGKGLGIWDKSGVYIDWNDLLNNTATYPCDEHGKRI